MNCRQCGHGNEPGARFCSSCGTPLDGDEITAGVPTVTADEGAEAVDAALAELPEGAAVLVVRRGPNAGSVFAVDAGDVAAGRHPDSRIFLDDITVSRRHAVVTRTDERFELRDAGSLNGTYVNHERVENAVLQSGDEIQIGRFVLTFHTAAPGRDMSLDAGNVHHSIGDVLGMLREEFPDITISKIRFLESQGLIDPERTPSGYRKFYDADVARLRWILHQQKEHFLPLKVIKGRLEQLELGEAPARTDFTDIEVNPQVVDPEPESGSGSADEPEPTATKTKGKAKRRTRKKAAPPPTLPLDDGRADELTIDPSGVSLTREELAKAAGLTDAEITELESFGLLIPATEAGGRVLFDEDGLAVARLASGFAKHGIGARHLRMYRSFAEREATLYQQALLAVLRQRNPEARARAQEELADLAKLGRGLRTAYLRQAARELLAE